MFKRKVVSQEAGFEVGGRSLQEVPSKETESLAAPLAASPAAV